MVSIIAFEQYVLFNYTTNQSPEQAFSFLFAKFFEYLRVFMLRSTIHLSPVEEGEFLLYIMLNKDNAL